MSLCTTFNSSIETKPQCDGITRWDFRRWLDLQNRILLSGVESENMKVKVAQSCLTFCNPMDYTVYGILQARILECVSFPFSRGSSSPRNWTWVSCIARRFFTNWAIREALIPFKRDSREFPCPFHSVLRQDSCLWTRNQALFRHPPICQCLDLGLPSLQNCEK